MDHRWRGVYLCLFLAMASSIACASTALDAVQVLKRERGTEVAASICEIRGEHGGPQPDKWIFLFNDPKSRSGIREMVVFQEKIISERTPMAEYGGTGGFPVLNIRNVKFDSDDVFRIANNEASSREVGFHWLDYKLTKRNQGAVWKIRITDYMGNLVGSLSVSAETGSILQPLKLEPDVRSSFQRDSLSPARKKWAEQGGLMGHANTTATNIVNSTKKTMAKSVKFTENTAVKTKNKILNITGNIQEWLTGKRTIDVNKD